MLARARFSRSEELVRTDLYALLNVDSGAHLEDIKAVRSVRTLIFMICDLRDAHVKQPIYVLSANDSTPHAGT